MNVLNRNIEIILHTLLDQKIFTKNSHILFEKFINDLIELNLQINNFINSNQPSKLKEKLTINKEIHPNDPNLFKCFQNNNPISKTMPKQNSIKEEKPSVVLHTPSSPIRKFFPEDVHANFNFIKPKIDFSDIKLTSSEKKEVEKIINKKFKHAMKVMDYSIADASTDMIADKKNPELWQTLNKFSSRYMDIYEAYVEVQKDNKEILLPLDVGSAKSFGYTHKEIISLVEPARWYTQNKNLLIKEMQNIGLKSKDNYLIADAFLHYLSENNYRAKSLEKLAKSPSKSELYGQGNISEQQMGKYLKNKKALSLLKQFCSKITQNKVLGNKIKNLENKMTNFGANRNQIEELKDNLSNVDLTHTMENKDSKLALLNEIGSRISHSEKEPGFVGLPFRLINIIKGKHDQNDDPGAIFRHKLFFIYKSKSIANEIISSSVMLKKVNEKLQKKGWQIDIDAVNHLTAKSPKTPIFKFGTYAKENWANNLRSHVPIKKVLKSHSQSPNLTFSEADRLAKGKGTSTQKELMTPFRLNFSKAEEMAYLGTTSDLEKRELKRRTDLLKKQNKKGIQQKADTNFFESPLDYKKKTTVLPWIPGKHFFELDSSITNPSPYLKAIKSLGLPQQAGISGSTDQTFTMASIVGIDSPEELKRLRFIYLGWMPSHDDHSVDEILTSAKSFGIPYTPSPDYYKEIYTEDPRFIKKLAIEQKKRGVKMPDFYLSKNSVKNELSKIRNDREHKQNTLVMNRLRNHSVFLKSIIGSKNQTASTTDLFQTKKCSPFLKKLNTQKKPTPIKGMIKYIYNPKTKQLEKHTKPKSSFYKGTKKTSVTLLPSHGKILPYEYDSNDSVGLLFDRKKSEFKDKYVFSADALTDNKWWKRLFTKQETQAPDFNKRLSQEVKKIQSLNGKGKNQSFNHLRTGSLKNLVSKIEKTANFEKHNEILASVKNEGILGVFGVNKKVTRKIGNKEVSGHSSDYSLYIRFKAIANKLSLKNEQGVDVPVFMIDEANNKGLALYSREEQLKDIQRVLKNEHGEFERQCDLIKEKTSLSRESIGDSLKKHLTDMQKQI